MGSYIFFLFPVHLFIHLSQRMETALECFDSILGAGSYRYTPYNYTICRKRKLKTTRRAKTKRMIRWRWMTCIAACCKEHYSVYDGVMLLKALTSYPGDKSVNSSKITSFAYPARMRLTNSDAGGGVV